MRQSQSRGGYDDFGEIENYQGFSNQKLQNFSNSKYSNASMGIKIVSNNETSTKQQAPQNKSKIAKKSDKKISQLIEPAREPLKSTNQQPNSKKKNVQDAKLYGSVIQKVDYPQKKTPAKPNSTVSNNLSPSPRIPKSPNILKNSSAKPSLKNKTNNNNNNENQNDKSIKDQFLKNKKNKNKNGIGKNISKYDDLQVLATKYSKFLQEKINSHQHCELQIMKDEKAKKTVTFQEPISETISNSPKPSIESQRPALSQSTTYSVERPEVQIDSNVNQTIPKQISSLKTNSQKKGSQNQTKTENRSDVSNKAIKIDDLISTPQKIGKDNLDLLSEIDSENDYIDNFNSIEPKVPPKPIEHVEYNKNKETIINKSVQSPKANNSEQSLADDQFKELLRKKGELDAKINNTIKLKKQQEMEFDNHFHLTTSQSADISQDKGDLTKDSIIPKIEQIQNSLSFLTPSSSAAAGNQTRSSLKIESSENETESTENSGIISNCNQLDPSSFVPKKRLFDMTGSDSVSDDDETEIPSKVNKSPALTKSHSQSINDETEIQSKVNKSPAITKSYSDEPKSPHVTWDISNCPPIRPKVTNKFEISKSFNFVNYDEINGYSEEAEVSRINNLNDHINNQIDFNSPVNFSKAMKLPKDFLYDINNNGFNYDDENNLLYDNYGNEEEDNSECVPNYSRILSILNKKLDETRYTEVAEIMNKNKGKHFCLLVSLPRHNVEALYLLRSDFAYAKLIWGEGLTKVYRDDVEKFFAINIASRKFEQLKTTEFLSDVDAFTVD